MLVLTFSCVAVSIYFASPSSLHLDFPLFVDYSPSRPVAADGDARGSLSRDSSLIFQQHVKSGSPASSDLPCEGRSGNQVTLHSKDAEGHAGDENAISLCLYLETRHRQEMWNLSLHCYCAWPLWLWLMLLIISIIICQVWNNKINK